MKTNISFLVLLMLLAASCKSEPEFRLHVTNTLESERPDAMIGISRDQFPGQPDLPEGRVPLLIDSEGNPYPSQADDLDGDGRWDELMALMDLGPFEKRMATLVFREPEEYPEFRVRTNIRLGSNEHGYPELYRAERLEGVSFHNYSGRTGSVFQMEGPGWETDFVGFRNYLDQRNGMDIFGKTTREMVLDSVGVAGRRSYHMLDHWGMDVLKVGTSLGAGAIGYMLKDSIYRVGDNGSGSYELLLEGPLRSRFNLSFQDWEVGTFPLDVVHRIEVIGGMRCYISTVFYHGTGPSIDLVPGIVNIKSEELIVKQLNGQFTGLLTHDAQAEDSTMLAMALIVPSASFTGHGKTRDSGEGITRTYYARLAAEQGKPVTYRFYALWEREDPRWASVSEVLQFLENEADRWSNPVAIEFISD